MGIVVSTIAAYPSGQQSALAILEYDVNEAVDAGATRLYLGYQVHANGAISSGTAFSWGTAGATWSPEQFGSAFKGVYAAGTTYAAGDVVASTSNSTLMYRSKAAGNVGNALSNTSQWEAASFTVSSTVQEVLAYSIGNTYYAGQRVNVGGTVCIPNATIPSGTAFALGTTGATWRVDTSDNKQYSTSEVFTGNYFSDGKPIYRRVYTVPDAIGNDAQCSIALGITVTSYFAIVGGFVSVVGGPWLILPGGSASAAGGVACSSYLNSAKNTLQIDGSGATDMNGGIVVVEYTR